MVFANNLLRAGFRLRIQDQLDFLRQEDIRCDVFKLPRKILERWRLFKTSENYDAVLIHKKCLNAWDMAVFSCYCPKTIFDFDDAIMYSSLHPESNLTSHFRLFKRTAGKMDAMIAGNEYLADHARKYCEKVYVLPTGLDTQPYRNANISKDPEKIRLVWIGSESTLKYLQELTPVFERIGKKYPHVVLRIIADRFFDLNHMRVEKCGWRLDTQVADLVAADIGLAPIPDNRFTRGKCGFKIIQYLAAGLPVIASPVGINEKLVRESKAGFLAADMTQWQNSVETMVKKMDHFRQWGERGQKYAITYDQSDIGRQFCNIIKSVMTRDSVGK